MILDTEITVHITGIDKLASFSMSFVLNVAKD